MIESICLNKRFSTARWVTKEQPVVKKNPEDKFQTILFLPKGDGRQGEGGLRTKGYFKTSLIDKPLVTVITVVFNGEKCLEETILSIINQTYDNVEYIIIDGGSTDGTLDIIRQYEHAIDYWVSEKDGGIYDAMNKSIDLITGSWANFMNAGDYFYNNEIIKQILDAGVGNYDLIYGPHYSCYRDGLMILRQPKDTKIFWKGMIASHQSFFVKKYLLQQHKFDIKYKLVADFEMLYFNYINGRSFYKYQQVISCTSSGGIADINRYNVIFNYWSVVHKYKCSIFYTPYYIYLMADTILRQFIKKCIPEVLINKIRSKLAR